MIEATIDRANIDLGVRHTTLALIQGVEVSDKYVFDSGHQEAQAIESATRWSDEDLRDHPALEGQRSLLRSIGYSRRKAMPAPERLIRMVKKRGRFPRINSAVDSYNAVVVEHGIGIGAHDADSVMGVVRFTRSYGGEPFTPIMRSQFELPPGDFIYRDERRVLGRLASDDCDEAKISLSTCRILIVCEGNPCTTAADVRSAVRAACQRIVRNCGGEYELFTPIVR